MNTLYPEVEPYASGWLDVGEGHEIYWQESGNPTGKTAVIIHGGPGSGSHPRTRRFFNPDNYRIIQFDQRHCGRSRPHASQPHIDLSTNTTDHLISDMEKLRHHLGVEKWLLYGGSWGCTLAQAYAHRHRDHVSEMVLSGVTATCRRDIEWLYTDAGLLFPMQHEQFLAGIPPEEHHHPVEAYHRLLMNPDPAIHQPAAFRWCVWEFSLFSTHGNPTAEVEQLGQTWQLTFARLVTHYFRHLGFLEDCILVREAHKLSGIPAILIHGRLDLGAPLKTAWELSKVWATSELVLVKGAGHSSSDPGMGEAIVAAFDRFADNKYEKR